MERKGTILLILLCAFLPSMPLITRFTSIHEELERFHHHNIRDVLVRKWYSSRHKFIPASHSCIEYQGRWMRCPYFVRQEASFEGSSITFAVRNTTSVRLSLANHPLTTLLRGGQENEEEHSLVLIPSKLQSRNSGPVDLVVSILPPNEILLHQDVYSTTKLADFLQENETYTFKVSLAENQRPSTIQFEGLWISEGGVLMAAPEETANKKTFDFNSTPGSILFEERECSKGHRQLLEIVAPETMLRNTLPQKSHSLTPRWLEIWPGLLEQRFENTTTSLVPFGSSTCLTRRCQIAPTKGQSTQQPLISRTFFRAGQPGTALYRRPWSFGSSQNNNLSPAALIVIIGVTDVMKYLSSSPESLQEVNTFLEEYARTYSAFVQTIRRTAYSASSLASYQGFDSSDSTTFIDESFLYNSAASTLPILLVLQPLPSSLVHPSADHVRLLLHHATSRVIDDLKWHIGDTKTFVVDTAGWLVDEDFAQGLHGEANVDLEQISLAQSGHIKFAHHMSLHLCHYIVDRAAGWSDCPFDRHNEYTGNLYLPDADKIKKLLEEKKIAAIKEMFGVS